MWEGRDDRRLDLTPVLCFRIYIVSAVALESDFYPFLAPNSVSRSQSRSQLVAWLLSLIEKYQKQ